jgi:hypothetical protein
MADQLARNMLAETAFAAQLQHLQSSWHRAARTLSGIGGIHFNLNEI